MNAFFKSHPDLCLLILAILLLAILITYFVWGIQTLIENLNKALSFQLPGKDAKKGFDLEGARALDLRGLVQ